jgi:hypothetical protein
VVCAVVHVSLMYKSTFDCSFLKPQASGLRPQASRQARSANSRDHADLPQPHLPYHHHSRALSPLPTPPSPSSPIRTTLSEHRRQSSVRSAGSNSKNAKK